ncbi:phthiocerol/phthiodiolone dimycocerosyl transferase [Mycobacterium malmoense]|uniref:Phthiocerol/phthiodiolone dimycocerosyl transferase n=1 Tax=Mycobacterium malmoense TaxID=1780 RepID=A0ABX3SN69_MYCMA|nr:phthiocerol/phthiodiolone dimycocerosyl transferase [Mycobacterium malmoense]OIN77962.1 acyltransferase [Mycobacterium malmoense]ORA77922.1 acyltransferase [Mycobacterium malmoense]QZA19026.1 phthiocerol/phthiodiolone dimycocerosyl transferase [Mycobacterium malmoense]UNB95792.1 phthiocerol/phthiodiolone dimycocerosyl transferase [Mycobacterium malmoense]
MFPGSVIRKLARSEEVFAVNETYFAFTVHVDGPVDIDAMSDAFDALLQRYPIFAGRLEKADDGRYQIVAEDFLHPGIWVVDEGSGASKTDAVRLDQRQALLNLRLTIAGGRTEVTLYTHHSLADAHHAFTLLEELFSLYTNVVTTGDPGPVTPQPAPESLELLLEQRGVTKQQRSGLERFFPVMFAYDLPTAEMPPMASNSGSIQPIPVTRIRLTEQETSDLVEFGLANRLSLNSVVAAAILLAEWQLRNTPHVPVPYIYPVDLRYLLSPPVSTTGSTLPVGVATYLAEIGPETDLVDLARGIVDAFRADLSDGVIQQSPLHFNLQYQGTPRGLPPIVLCTDTGSIPALRTPPGVQADDFESELHFPTRAPVDLYSCGTFANRLFLEHHAHLPGREKSLEAIHSLLCSLLTEDSWVME